MWILVEDILEHFVVTEKKCLRLSWMLLLRDKFFFIKWKTKVVAIKIRTDLTVRLLLLLLLLQALASIRWHCIPAMTHDNDNARNFTASAAAACGTIAVTLLISTWPNTASHTCIDRTQSKNRNNGRYIWLCCRFENNGCRCSRALLTPQSTFHD